MNFETLRESLRKEPIAPLPVINWSTDSENDVFITRGGGTVTTSLGTIHEDVTTSIPKWKVQIDNPNQIYHLKDDSEVMFLVRYFIILCAKRSRITSYTHRHLNTIFILEDQDPMNRPNITVDLRETNIQQVIHVSAAPGKWKISIFRLQRSSPGSTNQPLEADCFVFSFNDDTTPYDLNQITPVHLHNREGHTFTTIINENTNMTAVCNVIWEFTFTKFVTDDLIRRVIIDSTIFVNYYAIDMIYSVCSRDFYFERYSLPKPIMPIPNNQFAMILQIVEASKAYIDTIPVITSLATASAQTKIKSFDSFDMNSLLSELLQVSEDHDSYLDWE
jgi:hypothetical protein